MHSVHCLIPYITHGYSGVLITYVGHRFCNGYFAGNISISRTMPGNYIRQPLRTDLLGYINVFIYFCIPCAV